MRITELRAREDLDAILCETLESSLGEFCGADVGHVEIARGGGAHQTWRARTLLSAYCTDDLAAAGRRFLADQFRYTPVAGRAPAQWLVGTALASRAGLRAIGATGFTLSRPVPDADRYLIVPGNRRIRLFDFHRGLTRTVAKMGFDASSIEREVAARAVGIPGPFTKIEQVGPGGRWFQERILTGYPLPRCPPWQRRRRWESRAFTRLAHWLDATTHWRPFDDYAGELTARIPEGLTTLSAGSLVSSEAVQRLARLAGRGLSGQDIALALTHGDFQPGNIFVDTASRESVLIDWEFCAMRQRAYDGFTYALGARYPAGLADRIHGYVAGNHLIAGSALVPALARRDSRTAHIALFLLEELDWHVYAAAVGRYAHHPPSMTVFCKQLTAALGRGTLA